jgi:hypothetical protein
MWIMCMRHLSVCGKRFTEPRWISVLFAHHS